MQSLGKVAIPGQAKWYVLTAQHLRMLDCWTRMTLRRTALAIEHDHVSRYFMRHLPEDGFRRFIPNQRFLSFLAGQCPARLCNANLGLSKEDHEARCAGLRQTAGLPNTSAHTRRSPNHDGGTGNPPMARPAGAGTRVGGLAPTGTCCRVGMFGKSFTAYDLDHRIEQSQPEGHV